MTKPDPPRVFLSHSSSDKEFAHQLAWMLQTFKLDVWYDDWEIAVGDSIVEKVFDGLKASDTLVLILSPAAVQSRWVREEMNAAVMRRLSENNIRILPVLISTCEIPEPLKHFRYADFRESYDEGFGDLLDSLSPGHVLWKSLSHLYDHFNLICDKIAAADLATTGTDDITKLWELIESALDMRSEVEVRRSREQMRYRSFFEKIGFLVNKGVDIRSQTWNHFLLHRSSLLHQLRNDGGHLMFLAHMLRDRYPGEDLRGSLISGLNRMKDIMHLICFPGETKDLYSPTPPNTADQVDV